MIVTMSLSDRTGLIRRTGFRSKETDIAEGGGVGDGDLAVAFSTIGQFSNLQPVLFHWTKPQYFCKQEVRQSGRAGKHSL